MFAAVATAPHNRKIIRCMPFWLIESFNTQIYEMFDNQAVCDEIINRDSFGQHNYMQ